MNRLNLSQWVSVGLVFVAGMAGPMPAMSDEWGRGGDDVESIVMHFYPSRLRVKRLIEAGVKQVSIRGSGEVVDSRGRETPGSRIEYPSSAQGSNLNLFKGSADVDLTVISSAYPSRRSVEVINNLENHVALRLHLENCLTRESERDRLLLLARTVSVIVECRSDRAFERARDFAAQISKENEFVKIQIERVL